MILLAGVGRACVPAHPKELLIAVDPTDGQLLTKVKVSLAVGKQNVIERGSASAQGHEHASSHTICCASTTSTGRPKKADVAADGVRVAHE